MLYPEQPLLRPQLIISSSFGWKFKYFVQSKQGYTTRGIKSEIQWTRVPDNLARFVTVDFALKTLMTVRKKNRERLLRIIHSEKTTITFI